MILLRTCDVCSVEYFAQKRSARYCGERCKKRAQRAGLAAPRKIRVITPLPDGPSALELAVERELEVADKQDSALGAMARSLAKCLADPNATGTSVATLSKELRRTMDLVRQGVTPADDPIDELRRRRDRKRLNCSFYGRG
jgi:hypothetical protein